MTYRKTFRENEVLHFRLNQVDIKPVLEAMTSSFNRMMQLAVKNYNWSAGKHMKVDATIRPRGTTSRRPSSGRSSTTR